MFRIRGIHHKGALYSARQNYSNGSIASVDMEQYVGAILNIFKYFMIILILSTNYMFVHPLDNKVF